MKGMNVNRKSIIEGCIQNDYKSQKELYRMYYSTLIKVCLRYTKSIAEAEDVLLTGFYKIFKNIRMFDPAKSSFNSWACRIVANTAVDNYRKNHKHYDYCSIDDVNDSMILSEPQVNNLTSETVMKAVNELPEGSRIVFNLYVVEGFSHKEIADSLGVSVGTTKTQLSRARAYLQKRLADFEI